MQRKYQIIISNQAERELNQILNYIEVELLASFSAKKLFLMIKEKILELEYFPERYPRIRCKYLFGNNIRKTIVKNYVIIYKVNKKLKRVEISHIFYAKSDWMKEI